jgi:hypothetical protein
MSESTNMIAVAGSVTQKIVIAKEKRQPYTITCPGCHGFVFERTHVAAARAWASEHNAKAHSGLWAIEDRTTT